MMSDNKPDSNYLCVEYVYVLTTPIKWDCEENCPNKNYNAENGNSHKMLTEFWALS